MKENLVKREKEEFNLKSVSPTSFNKPTHPHKIYISSTTRGKPMSSQGMKTK